MTSECSIGMHLLSVAARLVSRAVVGLTNAMRFSHSTGLLFQLARLSTATCLGRQLPRLRIHLHVLLAAKTMLLRLSDVLWNCLVCIYECNKAFSCVMSANTEGPTFCTQEASTHYQGRTPYSIFLHFASIRFKTFHVLLRHDGSIYSVFSS